MAKLLAIGTEELFSGRKGYHWFDTLGELFAFFKVDIYPALGDIECTFNQGKNWQTDITYDEVVVLDLDKQEVIFKLDLIDFSYSSLAEYLAENNL